MIDGMDFDQIASAMREGKAVRGVAVSDEADVGAARRQFLRWLRKG